MDLVDNATPRDNLEDQVAAEVQRSVTALRNKEQPVLEGILEKRGAVYST